MPTALLAGAFGQRNPGDDALLEAFVEALPDWDVVATATSPGIDYGIPTVGSGDSARVARTVAQVDAVIFGGGTIFKELPARTQRPPLDLLQKGLALAYGAKALGRRVAMVGVGAAPVASRRGRLLARRLVHQADLLVLRDEESAQVLSGLGAPVPFRIGADPAWSLLGPPPARPDGRRIVVALSAEAGGERLWDELAATLVPLLAEGFEVCLQPWQVGGPARPDDLDMARAINARLGGAAEVVLPPTDLAEARAVFAEARLVLGLRFHSLVAAAWAGCPFVAYSHEPKLAALARRLRQPALDPDSDAESYARTLIAAARHAEPPAVAAVQAEIAQAEESLRLLRLVLSDGATGEPDTISALPLEPAEWSR